MNFNNFSLRRFQVNFSRWKRRDQVCFVGLLIVCSLLLLQTTGKFSFLPKVLVWNGSASAPVGFYMKAQDQTISLHDFVLVKTGTKLDSISSLYPTKPTYLLKHVELIPGERYRVDGNKIFTERQTFLRQKTSINGIKLPRLEDGVYVVPQGHYFVANFPEKSFDSRYFGPVPEEDIIQKVTPIIVVSEKTAERMANWFGNKKAN